MTDDQHIVELKVPALSAYVSVLRTTAAALAARLDFTIDEIEDLRIAVDEASALLLAQATSGSSLTCRFALSGQVLTTSVSAQSRKPHVPPEDSFAWTVLTALAGPIEATIDEADSRVSLTLTKRAEAVRMPDAEVHPLHARSGASDAEILQAVEASDGAETTQSGERTDIETRAAEQ